MEPELQPGPEEDSLNAVELPVILQDRRERRLNAIAGIVESIFLGELQRLVRRVVVLEDRPITSRQRTPCGVARPRQS